MVAKLTSCRNENKRLVSYAFTSRSLSEDDNEIKNKKAESNIDEYKNKTNVNIKCDVDGDYAAESYNYKINKNSSNN